MSHARFDGQVDTRWLPDGRSMMLLGRFMFTDSAGVRWIAPAREVVDGASIPRFLWPAIGSPFVGLYRRASVLHDAHCRMRVFPHQDVHRMFLEAMLLDGVPWDKANWMYAAVSNFGPKWDSIGQGKPVASPTEQEIKSIHHGLFDPDIAI